MLFNYEAIDRNGNPIKSSIDALNEREVIVYLESRQLVPTKIVGQEIKRRLSLSTNIFERITATDRIFLVRNLATAIKAGLSLNEALDILVKDTKKTILKNILIQAKNNIQSGKTLSQTFAEHRNQFPPIFEGLLKAGETASQLDKSLDELSKHLSKEYALVKKIKSALVYPTLLLIASVGVIIFLLTFLLPRLAKAFIQSGVELPLITRVLISMSNAITYSPILSIAITAIIIGAFIYIKRSVKGKRFFSFVLFKTPVVKELIKGVALIRFTRTLGGLLGGATPIIEAMRICSESVGNEYYKKAIVDAIEGIRGGVPLSKTLQKYEDLFPPLLTGLLAVGERTGNLEYVLDTFSNFYDDEIETKLKDLTTLFEPVLLLIMGLTVGAIAISVLLPIYRLVGEFA